MTRRFLIMLALSLVLCFGGCTKSDTISNSKADSVSYDNVHYDSASSYNENTNIVPEETEYTLSKEQAIAILTNPNKIWHNVGSRADVGKATENYYIFIDKGEYIEGEWHYSGEAEVMFKLSFEPDESGNLKLIYDGGDAYRSGTYLLADNYTDGLSHKKWFLDDGSFTFDYYTLMCRTYD